MTEIEMQDVVPSNASVRRTGKLAQRGALIIPTPARPNSSMPSLLLPSQPLEGKDVEVTLLSAGTCTQPAGQVTGSMFHCFPAMMSSWIPWPGNLSFAKLTDVLTEQNSTSLKAFPTGLSCYRLCHCKVGGEMTQQSQAAQTEESSPISKMVVQNQSSQ